jgi:predicted AAA+ superfamily ATPase
MKRKITERLIEWKNRPNHKPLILQGARQVGKSYILEEFGRNHYKNYVSVSLDLVTDLQNFLKENINPLEIIAYLESLFNTRILPHETLVILDEIQDCKRALLALKYFQEEYPQYDIVAAGSLLGVAVNKGVKEDDDSTLNTDSEFEDEFSYPVGKVDELTLYPMDFEEFLWATGNDMLMDFIRKMFAERKPMGQAFHRQAMDAFRLYMIVGGMPQAVKKYIETKDFEAVDAAKRDVLAIYRNDIFNYAGELADKVVSIFDQIPSQLSKHEKKFRLSALKPGAKYRDWDDAFFWLKDARVVNICYNSTDPNIGLKMNEDRTTLKCYLNDTGLLISHAFDEKGIVSSEIYQKLLFDKLEVNEGMLIENIVAQMLTAAGNKLFFYSKSSEDADNRMEIDFLIQKEKVTSRHNIRPIEVKSSKNYTLSSLTKCMKKFGEYMTTPTVLHAADYKVEDGITYLPLYMTPLL